MLVSVYMPTKNRLPLMRKAVASVLGQTHRDIELIVVDDGSTDESVAFLTEAAARDTRLRFIRNETSKGAQVSRNAAIKAAQGEFLTGIDDDDEFEPYRIEAFVNFWKMLDERGVETALLYAQDRLYSDGEAVGYTRKIGSVTERDLIARNHIGNQVFAPRQAFLDAGAFDESMPAWHDLDLFIRLLKGDKRGRLVDVPSYRFDVSPRPDRISSQRPRIMGAYKRLSATRATGREKQELMLQAFSPHYGFRPNLGHMVEFAALGLWPTGLQKMTKRLLGKNLD